MSATPTQPITAPLAGDPARQATDSILGYDYQIWRSVEAWLRLRAGEKLYLECAEDFDVVSQSSAVATQVKNSPTNITLNSEDVKEAIANFWALRERNVGREQLSMRFLTRGGIGKEQKSGFGAEKGLDLWRRASAGDDSAAGLIVDHLIKQGGAATLIEFLQRATPEELRGELFSQIEWATNEPSIAETRVAVTRLAVNMGNSGGTPPLTSERAVPGLLERCRQAAVETEPELRTLTVEDAQVTFATYTSLSVPITNQLVTAMGALAAGTAGVSGGTLTFSAAIFDGDLPELPVERLPRADFIVRCAGLARSSGCILIVGSEGEGKSTAANMLARTLGSSAFWMDLRGGDEQIATAAIENALVLARAPRPPACIVLDDVPAAQGVSDLIWGRLKLLIDAARRARVLLTMTSKGVPEDMVDPKFRAAGVPVAAVPRISQGEMEDFFLALGCPDKPTAQMWAGMTLAHSGSGHPKLVHLAGMELRDRGWRPENTSALLAAPRSIEEARAHARLTACKVVPQPDRDMLFALSVAVPAFERDLALDVGHRLGIAEPGAAFDRLAGRWVERRGRTGYKATPLLKGQAQELWPAQRVREIHALLLDAFMARKSLRVDEAMDLFLHAFQTEDPRRFSMFVGGLATKIDDVPGLAESLELLVSIGDSDGAPAIAFDEHASLLFRFLQFRVAKSRRPEALPDIARRWRWEIERVSEERIRSGMRVMRGMAVASAIEGTFSAPVLVEALRDASNFESLDLPMPSASALELGLAPDKPIDAMQLLFTVAQSHVTSALAISELLDELEGCSPDFRARLLGSFELPLAQEGFSMFDQALVEENRKSEPDFDALAAALRRAASLARAWQLGPFGAAASRTLSIVLDEHLQDRVGAEAALAEAADAHGQTLSLKDQMANLAFRGGDNARALELWGNCLLGAPGVGESGVRDPFAMRRAAIAAGKLGRFGDAAEWLERAGDLTIQAFPGFPAAPFRLDACYCWFKHGHARKALRSAALAQAEVRQKVDPKEAPRAFAAQKFAGQILMWIWKELQGAVEGHPEPFVGMASNPDLDLAAIATLVPTPRSIIALIIVESAMVLEIDEPWLAELHEVLAATKLPFAAMRYRVRVLSTLLARGQYAAAAPHVHHLNESYLKLRVVQRDGLPGHEEFDGEIGDDARAKDDQVARWAIAQVFALAKMNKANLPKLASAWRATLSAESHGEFLAGLAESSVAAFDIDPRLAMDLVRNSSDYFARVGAAASVLARYARVPLETAQSQWILAYILLGSSAEMLAKASLEATNVAFSRQWSEHLGSPALLANPRLSVPQLEAAIASSAPPSEKLVQLASAAAAAVGRAIPALIATQFTQFASSRRSMEANVAKLAATTAVYAQQ